MLKALNKRADIYNEQRLFCQKLEKKKKAIVLLPSEPIEISRYEKDSDTLMAIYDMGYTDAMKRMNEIKAMIAEHSTQTVSVEG